VKVCFVATESDTREFFSERLAHCAPIFVRGLEDVPADTEIVSVFIDHRVGGEFLDAHPAVRLIATRSSGVDHIDVETCRARGVAVVCAGGSDGNSVAEHTFALLLAVARRMRNSTELRQHGDFSHAELRGFELRGKTLGLIGVGRIGARVVELALAFGMKILAYDPKTDDSWPAQEENFRYASLETVLAEAEILSLHAALTEETHHLLNAKTLAKCQSGVVIINTARGALIDTPALVQALESGQVGGVGLDVLEDERVLRTDAKNVLASEIASRVHNAGGAGNRPLPLDRQRQIERLFFNNALLARPEVVFTPHIAFNTTEAIDAVREGVAKNIEDFLVGRAVA
jgi:D-lactate dehydrogenase